MTASKVLVSAVAAAVLSIGVAYAQSPSTSPSQTRSPSPSGVPNDPGLPGNPVGATGSVQTQSQATPPAGQPDGMRAPRQSNRPTDGSAGTMSDRSTGAMGAAPSGSNMGDTRNVSGERAARADRN